MADATHPVASHLAPQLIRARAKVMARGERTLKAKLIRARREVGLSQREVAETLGVSQQAIHKLERYDSDPKLSTLARYANAVGVIISHEVATDKGQSVWLAAGPRWGGSVTSPRQNLSINTEKTHAPPTVPWEQISKSAFKLVS